MIEVLSSIDENILIFLQNNIRNPLFDSILIPFTKSNNHGILAIVIVALLIIISRYRKVGITALLALIIDTIIINLFIKPTVARIRPYDTIEGLHLLLNRANDYSFPSGHTGSIFAVATVIFLLMPKKFGIPALTVAILMGFSRVYVGIHYPSDVICGMLFGIISAAVAIKISKKRGLV